MRLIDAEPLSKSLADSKAECLEWIKEAEEQGDHELVERAREAMVTFIECRLRVMNAPTIEERKKGKWISREGEEDCYECSECHAVIEGDEVYWRNNYFCYHCGADMRGEHDG